MYGSTVETSSGNVVDVPLSEEEERESIARSSLVWRMCFYGFLKNMKFFEAFLLIILMHWGLNLYQIGVLQSVQYFFAYVFEIPAGVFADHFGLKRILLLSFACYVASYCLYALGETYMFGALVPAAVVYGIGEAGRSGTHKAMIMRYLDRRGMAHHKAFVYSRTRSFSNLGSAVNAVLSVALVLHFRENYAALFWVSAVPMCLDFVLVATYPAYMNEIRPDAKRSLKRICVDTKRALGTLMCTGRSRRAVLSASLFLAIYTTLKHYVQPIVKVHGASMLRAFGVPADRVPAGKNVLLGVIYAIFYLVSSVGTRNSWRLKACFRSPKHAMDVLFESYIFLLFVVAAFLLYHRAIWVVPCYLCMFLLQNLWKPWGVAGIASLLGKKRRALSYSAESLVKTILQFFFAPIVGYVSDRYSLDEMFAGAGILLFVFHMLVTRGDWEEGSDVSVMPPAAETPAAERMDRETRKMAATPLLAGKKI